MTNNTVPGIRLGAVETMAFWNRCAYTQRSRHLIHLSLLAPGTRKQPMPLFGIRHEILHPMMPTKHVWEPLVFLGPLLPVSALGQLVHPYALPGEDDLSKHVFLQVPWL